MDQEDSNEDVLTNSLPHPGDLPSLSKRLKIDSTSSVPPQEGAWSFSNKPVGIAQPFQKKDSDRGAEFLSSSSQSQDPVSAEVECGGLKSGVGQFPPAFENATKGEPTKGERGNEGNDIGKRGSESSDTTDSLFDLPTSVDSATGKEGLEFTLTRDESGRYPLPQGKKCHVFVTHSTSDQAWAEKHVVKRLCGSNKWLVRACYHFLAVDKSRYDDASIHSYMRNSCIIIIGFSQGYTHSQRCRNEQRLAVQCSQERLCSVIVASVLPCSRPQELRPFLYLDFYDRRKEEPVWNRLLIAITDYVQQLLSQQKREADRAVISNAPTGISHGSSKVGQQQQPSPTTPFVQHYSSGQHTATAAAAAAAATATTTGTTPTTGVTTSTTEASNTQQQKQQQFSSMQDCSSDSHTESQHSTNHHSFASSFEHPLTDDRTQNYSYPPPPPHPPHHHDDDGDSLSLSHTHSRGSHTAELEEAGHMMTDFEALWEEGRGSFSKNEGSVGTTRDSGFSSDRGRREEEEERRDPSAVSWGEGYEAGLNSRHGEGQLWDQDKSGGGGGGGVGAAGDGRQLGGVVESMEEGAFEGEQAEGGSGGGGVGMEAEMESRKGEMQGGQLDPDSEVKVHDVEEGEVSDSSDETRNTQDSKSSDVAVFYDNLARPDVDKRNESPIKLMRNFNNWVKSILIRTYLKRCPEGCTALDLCCGKGGDLLKWKEGRISHLVCADISGECVSAAKDRYHSDKMRVGRDRDRRPFTADFYVADCTEERLADLANSRSSTQDYSSSCVFYHISSCQFSVHYSFQSYSKAHMMLRNACENLRPGGFFIGTTIDSNQLVHRLRNSGNSDNGSPSIGNDLFTVTLDPKLDINKLPLFGARYNFKLHGVVDLPEYLIYFPLLVRMLEQFDMEMVLRQNFYDFFIEHRHNSDDNELLFRMEAFDKKTGTMSMGQWEIVGLYLVYVFRKKTVTGFNFS